MRSVLLATMAVLFLLSCESPPDPPEDLIEEEAYTNLIAELTLARSLINTRSALHVEDSLRQVLFEHYGTNRNQFDRSHAWYQRQPERQMARLDSINAIFREQRVRINEGLTKWEEDQRNLRQEREEGSAEADSARSTGQQPEVPADEP
ncbi:MAG: DUF4296 domain-containing protein [Balneolaceae bacterium]